MPTRAVLTKGDDIGCGRTGMDVTNFLWFMMVALGPVLLAVLLAFALLKRRRPGPAERRERDEETRRGYDEKPAPGRR
jgi:hypothetical protein